MRLWFLGFYLCIIGCAGYRFGTPERSFPGDYHFISVPIFKNLSQETGAEVTVTNAMIREIERAKVGRVTDRTQAEVELEGVIQTLVDTPLSDNTIQYLRSATLASQHKVYMSVKFHLVRLSDKTSIWEGEFTGEKAYTPASVTRPVLNSVNPLYDLSARRQMIEQIAADMMAEAHDRLTENF